jgi:hypothetical protein
VAHERLDAPERLGEGEALQRGDEPGDGRLAAGQVERDDAAEPVLLAEGERVLLDGKEVTQDTTAAVPLVCAFEHLYNISEPVTLSVGERSANFDAVIPNSALRTDTNGTFVLVLTVKHSPLGNRYIATRVDVNVLAQDDTTAAVSGLSMGDYVITTSSKPLEAGMQVNMVEN